MFHIRRSVAKCVCLHQAVHSPVLGVCWAHRCLSGVDIPESNQTSVRSSCMWCAVQAAKCEPEPLGVFSSQGIYYLCCSRWIVMTLRPLSTLSFHRRCCDASRLPPESSACCHSGKARFSGKFLPSGDPARLAAYALWGPRLQGPTNWSMSPQQDQCGSASKQSFKQSNVKQKNGRTKDPGW